MGHFSYVFYNLVNQSQNLHLDNLFKYMVALLSYKPNLDLSPSMAISLLAITEDVNITGDMSTYLYLKLKITFYCFDLYWIE